MVDRRAARRERASTGQPGFPSSKPLPRERFLLSLKRIATSSAYGRGEIELPTVAKGTDGRYIRTTRESIPALSYTKKTVSEFLGWTIGSGKKIEPNTENIGKRLPLLSTSDWKP